MRSTILNEFGSLPAEEQDILRYLPTAETPGFKRASPRVFKILVALIGHALRFPAQPIPTKPPDSAGSPSEPTETAVTDATNGRVDVNLSASASITPRPKPKSTKESRRVKKQPNPPRSRRATIPVTPGLESQWTVTGLADACGCNRNTAGATLSELVALGWIRKSIERHSGGEYSGFWYRLLVPPSTLTMTAQHLYQSKADKAEVRLRERRARMKESIKPDSHDSISPTTEKAAILNELGVDDDPRAESTLDDPEKEFI